MPAFTIRSWEDTLQRMLGWIQGNPNLSPDFTDPNAQNIGVLATDLTTGSLEVANLEALAMVMEDYDVRAQQAVNYAISESAYNAFGFPPLTAVSAAGTVTLTAFAAPLVNLTIPSGFMVTTADGVQFQTTAACTLLAGTFSVAVSVQAVVPGVGGNQSALTLQQIVYPLAGVDAVVNASPTWGGKDAETPGSRATRFQAWVQSLQRGTTCALEYAALVVAPTCGAGFSILGAYAVEPSSLVPAGLADGSWAPFAGISYAGVSWLFVDDGTQGLVGTWNTSPSYLAVQTALNGGVNLLGQTILPWKAAGIFTQILPVQYLPVYATAVAALTPQGNGRQSSIQTALNNAALNYFNSLNVGDPVVYWSLLAALGAADPDVLSVSFLGIGTTGNPTGTSNLTLDPFAQCGFRFITAANPYLNWSFA